MDPKSPASTKDGKLLVQCNSWHAFVSHYATDLTQGGMYVETASTPELLSVVDVCLCLPQGTEIILQARVVQVLNEQQAAALGKARGVGLEVELDAERKRQVVQLIEFARWQGASNDPNASFTRTLLEVSQPLAPAEVGYRLSLMPGPRTSDGPRAASRFATPEPFPSKHAPAKNSRPASRPIIIAANEAAARGSRPNLNAAESDPGSSPSNPAANPEAGSGSRPSLNAAAPSQAPSSESQSRPSALPATDVIPPQTKPTDQIKLKLVLTNFAHKHYDAALRVASEMLAGNPTDHQAMRWQHMCNARVALSRAEPAAAAQHYEGVLRFDPENREAKEFVRNFRRDQKLNSLPFGRYFTKKK
jgi:hypothetical protein